jgi:hypothetical protein
VSCLAFWQVAVTVLIGVGAGHAASAHIRVNQLGTLGTKRACLMPSAAKPERRFCEKFGGSTVYSAAMARIWKVGNVQLCTRWTLIRIGRWYYTISVTCRCCHFTSFKIDSERTSIATPLANSLFYFETSRDGANYIPNSRCALLDMNDQARSGASRRNSAGRQPAP